MAIEMIVDPWNPSKRRYRTKTSCHGPHSCPLHGSGPPRKGPGRRGMTSAKEHWADQDATAQRGPDESLGFIIRRSRRPRSFCGAQLLPAGFGVIGRGEAHRFDFVNLAAADLENVRGRHIEWVDIQWHLIDARHANNRYVFLLHGMAELR
jgi:hypothetical protein